MSVAYTLHKCLWNMEVAQYSGEGYFWQVEEGVADYVSEVRIKLWTLEMWGKHVKHHATMPQLE